MPSALVSGTLQAALLAGVSNVLAQLIKSYKSDTPLVLELPPLLQFVLFALLNTPPNFLWQKFLEEKYPGYSVDSRGERKLDKRNTAKKFALDQTVAATLNTLLFIAGIGALKGKDGPTIMADCQRDFWPIMRSSLKLWPFVSLLCFTVVPVNQRIIVGSLVGLFWGIYLSLQAG